MCVYIYIFYYVIKHFILYIQWYNILHHFVYKNIVDLKKKKEIHMVLSLGKMFRAAIKIKFKLNNLTKNIFFEVAIVILYYGASELQSIQLY